MTVIKKLFSALLFTFSAVAIADPWVNPNDIFLRNDIQQLADAGVITAPINHWPIMWNDIAPELVKLSYKTLNTELQNSYLRIMFEYKQAKAKNKPAYLSIYGANEASRFQHFHQSGKEKAELTISKNFIGESFAGRLQTTRTLDPQDDKDFRFDGSYLAYSAGNWNISAGYIPMWWGPGWDTSLILSNNARPIPGISINRQRSTPFETPWLSWLGHWSITTFMGQLEERGRAVKKPLFWATRLSIRPFSSFELGLSRTTQWGGTGRDNSISGFWDIIIPSESENKINNDTDVNDIGAIDWRWNSSLFDQTFGIYYELAFEDYGISRLTPSKRSHLIGFDTDFTGDFGVISLFAEATDTYHAECQCVYQHDIYESGYTHRDRIIGSTYGSNAHSLVVGLQGQTKNENQWQVTARKIELNKHNEYTIQTLEEDNQFQQHIELETSYRFVTGNSRWQLGALYRKIDYLQAEDDDETQVSLRWEYKH